MADICDKNAGELVNKEITEELKEKVQNMLNEIPCSKEYKTGGAGDDEKRMFNMTKSQWLALLGAITPAVMAIAYGMQAHDLNQRGCQIGNMIVDQLVGTGNCEVHRKALDAAVKHCINSAAASVTATGVFAWMVGTDKKNENNTTGGRKTKKSRRKSKRGGKSRRARKSRRGRR